MGNMEEVRIGGSKTLDIVAMQWSNDDRIDCLIRDRRMRTPQGELFEALLMNVAPHAIGRVPPDQIILFCRTLSAMAQETLAEVPMSIPTPSQATLRRKIAKHKEKTNGSRP